jgi:hypothetical protein
MWVKSLSRLALRGRRLTRFRCLRRVELDRLLDVVSRAIRPRLASGEDRRDRLGVSWRRCPGRSSRFHAVVAVQASCWPWCWGLAPSGGGSGLPRSVSALGCARGRAAAAPACQIVCGLQGGPPNCGVCRDIIAALDGPGIQWGGLGVEVPAAGEDLAGDRGLAGSDLPCRRVGVETMTTDCSATPPAARMPQPTA